MEIRGSKPLRRGLEMAGDAVIALAFLYATVRGLPNFNQRKPCAYEGLKISIGRTYNWGWNFWSARIYPDADRPIHHGRIIVARITRCRTHVPESVDHGSDRG